MTRFSLAITSIGMAGLGLLVSALATFGIPAETSHFLTAIGFLLAISGATISLLMNRRVRRAIDSRQVFLIYDSKDRRHAKELAALLRAEGFVPWIDTEMLKPGMDWRQEITRAQERSPATLFLTTENLGPPSTSVSLELERALNSSFSQDSRISAVIPVLIGAAEVPRILSTTQAVRLDDADGRDQLVEALRRVYGLSQSTA